MECLHFIHDPDEIEKSLPGLTILSSARGSTRGRAGICQVYGTLQDPVIHCPCFEAGAAHSANGIERVTHG